MADDERLREALFELEFLREREAQMLRQTLSLAACLEAYSTAPDPQAAMAALMAALRDAMPIALAVIVTRYQGGLGIVSYASDGAHRDAVIAAPFDLFQRKRNIAAGAAEGWQAPFDLQAMGGVLICPVGPKTSLLAFARLGAAFGKADAQLFERVAGLFVQAERNAALADENDLLAQAIAGSSSGFAIADATQPQMPLVYVNRAFETISGYSAMEVLGKNCRFLAADPPDAPERVRLRQAVADRTAGRFLLRNRRKDGTPFWNELTLFPIHDKRGVVKSMVATQSDVTEREAASAARDQARARMEQAFGATEDAFLVLEADGTVALSNDAMRVFFPAPGVDWRAGTRFDANWAAYLEAAAEFPGRITALVRDANLNALAGLRKNGRELDLPDGRSVLARCAMLDDGGLVVTVTDISAMKSARNLLAQRLAAIEAAPDGIAITDDNGRLVYLNPAAARQMGFQSADSGLGRIWWHQYRNHAVLSRSGAFEAVISELDDGKGTAHEITSSPLERAGRIVIIRDVTEKLANEARAAELTNALSTLRRQEAIAHLAAGVAHDFNNYLAAINGSATLIEMERDLPPSVRDHVHRIALAGAQSARLVNRLLDLGSGSGAGQSFDLGAALAQLAALAQPMLHRAATVYLAQDGQGMTLRGDAAEFNQILLNLLLNASDALGDEGGRLSLRVARFDGADAPTLQIGDLMKSSRYAEITVADTGIGMDETTLSKLFEPYFSTKGAQGTGLGMAMVAAQTAAGGGALSVLSAPGRGTTVRLFWPLAEAAPDQPQGTRVGPDALAGQTILLVDDDAHVSDVIARYLEAHGAEVAQCDDPRDAADAIAEDPAAWSALVSDYDMPGLTGGVLAEAARAHAPALPIVIVTALAKRLNDPRLVDAGVMAILPKPVDLDRLGETLAEAAQLGK